jgi:hypothetical protein
MGYGMLSRQGDALTLITYTDAGSDWEKAKAQTEV